MNSALTVLPLPPKGDVKSVSGCISHGDQPGAQAPEGYCITQALPRWALHVHFRREALAVTGVKIVSSGKNGWRQRLGKRGIGNTVCPSMLAMLRAPQC